MHGFRYLNNMGCAHFRMGKHNAAAFYFLKALRENNAMQIEPAAGGSNGGKVRGSRLLAVRWLLSNVRARVQLIGHL